MRYQRPKCLNEDLKISVLWGDREIQKPIGPHVYTDIGLEAHHYGCCSMECLNDRAARAKDNPQMDLFNGG